MREGDACIAAFALEGSKDHLESSAESCEAPCSRMGEPAGQPYRARVRHLLL